MLPVTTEPGVVVTADLDKMANSTAVPRSTQFTGVALGEALGDTLGPALGYPLEEAEGLALGDWEALGEALGDADGPSLGETLGGGRWVQHLARHSGQWKGQHWIRCSVRYLETQLVR
jgi:hypothetical protein